MSCPPRLLMIEDEAEARAELGLIGCDPEGAARMAAKMVRRLVKLHQVPCRAANILKQEMLALGGDAAVARGSVACTLPATDVILIGSLKQLRRLCRRLRSQPFGLPEVAALLERTLDGYAAPAEVLDGLGVRLDLSRPRIMGILNITPDSFSDGGRFLNLEAALAAAERMVAEGADLIDVGGESTRPGASSVPLAEELDRVIPVIAALRRAVSVPLSIDTTKAEVARAAIAEGAAFVNDISGLRFDSGMSAVVAAGGAGLIVMHTPARPATMQDHAACADVPGTVFAGLAESLAQAQAAGIPAERVAIDPGIGFGKTAAGNLTLLRRLEELKSLGRPILVGTSRKSFIGKVLGIDDPLRRSAGSLATVALAVQAGARLLRVHDVGPSREAALMAWAVSRGEFSGAQRGTGTAP